jgi:lipopolysaccharide biosynthesis glycosyltransferase
MNTTGKKKLLLTIACGDYYQRMAEITHPFLRGYAEKIGADFQCISEHRSGLPAHFQKMSIHGFLEHYDRILFMDTDILVKHDAPDLFSVVDERHLGLLDQSQHFPSSPFQFRAAVSQWGYDLSPERYYNTGVMVISKIHRDLFRIPVDLRPEQVPFDQEQTILNLNFLLAGTEIHELEIGFNHLVTSEIDPDYLRSPVMHYAGYKTTYANELLEKIREDAAGLATDHP